MVDDATRYSVAKSEISSEDELYDSQTVGYQIDKKRMNGFGKYTVTEGEEDCQRAA